MLTKNQTKLNRFSRTVVKDKLNCDLAPCLNYGTCTLSPFNSLGFFCICPPGYYGDFCQHRTIERFTTISFIGILVILILILALCIAVCCLCHRERKHHRVIKQIRSSEVCSNLLSKAYASKSPCSPCPYTEEYQEKREKKDCKHQVEPANVECHHGAKRNDHCPELTGSQQKKTKLAEQGRRKCPSNAISRAPCPDDKLNSPAESSHSRTTLSKICRSISSLIGNGSPPRQSDVPDDRLNSPVESCHSRTTLSKKDGSLIDKGSPPRQSDVPDDRLNSPVGSSHSRTTLSKKDTSKSSLIDKGSPPRQSDFPDQRSSQQNLTAVSKQSRHISSGMDSSNAACQSDIAGSGRILMHP
ncbi:uncharacterized protein [Heptranchias perlo]|uniref:uncharacterized protein isoform X3 n=1 Tax=Heptranchias perlo TaxID=212740 RepID=UPI003559A8C5